MQSPAITRRRQGDHQAARPGASRSAITRQGAAITWQDRACLNAALNGSLSAARLSRHFPFWTRLACTGHRVAPAGQCASATACGLAGRRRQSSAGEKNGIPVSRQIGQKAEHCPCRFLDVAPERARPVLRGPARTGIAKNFVLLVALRLRSWVIARAIGHERHVRGH